jgi:hypothetical protein
VTVEPAALAEVPNLQHLVLRDIRLGGEATMVQFLSQLGKLSELSHLQVCGEPLANAHLVSEAAFAALTASSKLQQLDLANAPLPEGAWHHMFPVSVVNRWGCRAAMQQGVREV